MSDPVGRSGMSADRAELVRMAALEAQDAARSVELVRAWVVDEVDGMVQIRLGDEATAASGDTARYRRVKGPPLLPGQVVQCVRTPGGYIVLGAIQQGAGTPEGVRVEAQGTPVLTMKVTRAIDFGVGFTVAAEDAAAPDTDTDEVNVGLDFGYVQRPLLVSDLDVTVKANPTRLDFREGFVASDGGTDRVNVTLDYSTLLSTTAGETDAGKVPRATQTQRKITAYPSTGSPFSPDGFGTGAGMVGRRQNDGFLFDADFATAGGRAGSSTKVARQDHRDNGPGDAGTFAIYTGGPRLHPITKQIGRGQVALTTLATTLSRTYLVPVIFSRPVVIDQIGFEVTTAAGAGGTMVVGLWSTEAGVGVGDQGSLRPYQLVSNAVSVSTTAAGFKSVTLNPTSLLANTYYFLALRVTGAACTVRTYVPSHDVFTNTTTLGVLDNYALGWCDTIPAAMTGTQPGIDVAGMANIALACGYRIVSIAA